MLVTPYVDEHKNSLCSKHPEQCDDWITCEHIRTFSSWLETRLKGDNTVCDEMYLLSRGPSLIVLTYKGYEINGNTFTRSPKIKRAPTKTAVSALMQQPRGKRACIIFFDLKAKRIKKIKEKTKENK